MLNKVTFALVVVLAIAGVLYERHQSQETAAALQALARDRDFLEDKIEKLTRRMMQAVSGEEYRGKRVKLSGWMKTEDANEGGGHLWLRVDGQQVGASLQFDNMNNRAPKGTTDWQQYSVVLDVPAEASALAYG